MDRRISAKFGVEFRMPKLVKVLPLSPIMIAAYLSDENCDDNPSSAEPPHDMADPADLLPVARAVPREIQAGDGDEGRGCAKP